MLSCFIISPSSYIWSRLGQSCWVYLCFYLLLDGLSLILLHLACLVCKRFHLILELWLFFKCLLILILIYWYWYLSLLLLFFYYIYLSFLFISLALFVLSIPRLLFSPINEEQKDVVSKKNDWDKRGKQSNAEKKKASHLLLLYLIIIIIIHYH